MTQKEALIFDWIDTYVWTKDRKVLTFEEIKIPGIKMFGKHTMSKAIPALPTHYHKNTFEFTLVTNGNLSFTTDQDSFELSGYDIFMTYPNEVHSTNFIPLSAGEILWFQIDISDSNHLLFLDSEASNILYQRLLELKDRNLHLFHTNNTKIVNLAKKAFEVLTETSNAYRCANYISFILWEIGRAHV